MDSRTLVGRLMEAHQDGYLYRPTFSRTQVRFKVKRGTHAVVCGYRPSQTMILEFGDEFLITRKTSESDGEVGLNRPGRNGAKPTDITGVIFGFTKAELLKQTAMKSAVSLIQNAEAQYPLPDDEDESEDEDDQEEEDESDDDELRLK